MANNTLVRCPVCLITQSLPGDYPPTQKVYCGNCGRDFLFKNALPVSDKGIPGAGLSGAGLSGEVTAPVPPQSESEIPAKKNSFLNAVITWALGLILMWLVLQIARPIMATLKGPGFLFFYGVVFIAILISVSQLRKVWYDSAQISILGLIIYEAIGVARFNDGSAAGMHKFEFMFFMMVIGGFLMFTGWQNSSGSSSSSSSCSSSNGGSSCSGCGGGGGCGGCGG
jgi:uncharacterized membrane protein YgcG